MGLLAEILSSIQSHLIAIAILSSTALIILLCVYRIFFHPLAKVPGPVLAKVTSLWLYCYSYVGNEATVVHQLHEKYGPVIRVAPNDVDIADGHPINAIYVDRGGFLKSECYVNFHIDGHESIFSTLSPSHRAPRAKAVVGMFSTSALRGGSQVLYGCVDRFVARMKMDACSGKPVNVLNLTRSLATDAVTAYLFGENYGGLDEDGARLSSSPFVDAFVAVGRFFYLPNRMFLFLEWFLATFMPDKHTNESMTKVDEYVATLVSKSGKSSNYPSRLLQAGFSESETRAQCKDLIFAGTDSTGMNLATICWYLARNPEIYDKLKAEVTASINSDVDIQGLPYLKGVVREGLRLAMANPTRMPRAVPAGGWEYGGYHFPAGANVGVSPFELHLDPSIFPQPERFLPERWSNPTEEMQINWIPFGMGSRACIARNLATVELFMAVEKLVKADVLGGATAVQERIEIKEWFNSKVKSERIELIWS